MTQTDKKLSTSFLEIIKKRRSIRSYDSKPVPKEFTLAVIEAGNQAPSRGRDINGVYQFQPWRFVVAEDPELKKKLIQTTEPIWKQNIEEMKETHPETYENAMMRYESLSEPKDPVYYSAPTILFVIGPITYSISCALACENMMLAATSLGLGSCYVGFGALITHNDELVQVLGLNEDERIYGPILLGYPQEKDELLKLNIHKKDPIIKWT